MAERRMLYVGTYADGIYQAWLDEATGELSEPQRVALVARPAYLTLNRAQDRLYCVGEDGHGKGGIFSFARDGATGKLEPLGSCLTGEGPLCHLSLDYAERRLFAASYRDGMLFCFELDRQGKVERVCQRFDHPGASRTVPGRQDGSHAHFCALSPDGFDLLAADLGTDQIVVYRYDAAAGQLTRDDARTVAVRAGEGPRHLVMHPDRPFIYLLCELGCTLMTYLHEQPGGRYRLIQALSSLPESFDGKGESAAVRISPDGRFLYATNRGCDDLAVFSIDGNTGMLAPAAHINTAGAFPRDVNLTPDGAWMVAANQHSGTLTSFCRDAQTGVPAFSGFRVAVPEPVCVIFSGR